MVSGISGTSAYQYQQRTESTNSLTEEQKKTLQDIIAKYDPENMTSEDTKSMMDEIKEAGIKPSKEFGEIMNTAGFKPPERPSGPPPSGPPPSETQESSTDNDLTSQLLDLLNEQKSGSVSEEDLNTFIETLKSSGNSLIGTLINQKV